ncbi:uncharacterized protein LOC141637132 [Silene latifolia]|uniref:uncharacterized protein LOC141637132 n=1 Tax=Silene latifolia TaxID=37657 RepID=UPI003D77A888
MDPEGRKTLVMIKNDEGNASTSINDLNDEMLLEILCQVDCYSTALRCKTVSKRWCSIVSAPSFVAEGFVKHRDIINEKEQPWTFLSTMTMWDKNIVTAVVTPPCCERILRSPILSLQFLPFPSKVIATFRDLNLCLGVNPVTGEGVFYICNLLTKQWLPLPPSPTHREVNWAALVCQEGRGFRVVVAQSMLEGRYYLGTACTINLLIYLSDTCQWKNIDIVIESQPYGVGSCHRSFVGVVCKGMVLVHRDIVFGAFDPFDVTDTFEGTLTAIALPLPPKEPDMRLRKTPEVLLESCGKLIAIESMCLILRSDLKGNLIAGSQAWHIWKLDPRPENEVVVGWELISMLHGEIQVKGSLSVVDGDNKFKFVGVHPNKEHLVYLISVSQNQLVLCDTKSNVLEPLMIPVPPHQLVTSYKLEFPRWPVPYPWLLS